jgi:hypothetical protein
MGSGASKVAPSAAQVPSPATSNPHTITAKIDQTKAKDSPAPSSAPADGVVLQGAGMAKLERLRNLDLFVLDNTLRETTVAQLKGHTLADKLELLELSAGCGFKDLILGTFSERQRRVDDELAIQLRDDPELVRRFKGVNFYAFAELLHSVATPEALTVGLRRAQEYRIPNIIIEMELISPVGKGTPGIELCRPLRLLIFR